jgi:Family of unknown function (DUF6049)
VSRVLAVIIAAIAVALVAPPGAATGQPQSSLVLEVESLAPRVVTATTPNLTVTGKVTNTGDRRIDNVRVQLLRDEPLNAERKLREPPNQNPEAARTQFVAVTDRLERGQSAQVQLTVPVRGQDGLRIEAPGVYPVLVNINGQPEFSGRARLAAVSVLLPVLSVPGGGTTPRPDNPAGLTVLWPLIDDYPRLLSTQQDGQAVLSDDGLTDSLAPGGRLYGLVNAAQQADPDVLDALCFAVDPDLLETVRQMANGYRVRQGDGAIRPGTGADTARTWLTAVQALTAGRCVFAVPYADADLVALSRAGAVDLEKLAMTSGSVVANVLKPATPLNGVLWPAGGTLDQRTLLDVTGGAAITVLANPAQLQNRQGAEPYSLAGEPGTRVLPIDTLVSSFLDDGRGSGEPVIATTQERPVSMQNGLAALTYELAFAGGGRSGQLIAPPRRWAAPVTELEVFLQTLHQVFAEGLAAPRRLGDALSGAQGGTASGLEYAPALAGSEVAPSVTAEVARINTAQRDFVKAMAVDDTALVDPHSLVVPIEYGLLRSTSSAWRGRGEQATRMVSEVSGQLDALRGQVTVANPGRPLTLASGNSPIPVLISNALPVSVVVRIKLGDTPGLRPEPIPDVVIPARLSVNRYLPAEVIRSGRFTVDVSLSTPGGTPLGSTARLELTSTTYGSVTLIITATAAVALFLLVGLRIFRRVRAARKPASENPTP